MTPQLTHAIRATRHIAFHLAVDIKDGGGFAALMAKLAVGDLRRALRHSVAAHALATPSTPSPDSFFAGMGRNSMSMRRAVGIAQAAHYYGLTTDQVMAVIS